VSGPVTRSGSALAAALAVIGLSCTPLPPVDDGFETQWSAAGAQCDTYSVYCNVTLRTAWKERAAPFASACKRELDRPDPSGYRIIVTLGAAGEILHLSTSPFSEFNECFAERIESVRFPAPPVAGFRFPVTFGIRN